MAYIPFYKGMFIYIPLDFQLMVTEVLSYPKTLIKSNSNIKKQGMGVSHGKSFGVQI